eukprot:TRINITY_DN4232_c0_g1_i2.p1 TRINITY_DN4232_c0_g1~~TRINITY_DN4232_c0_g1_i2.p1  ORF type:complete len:327 (+),score=31.46 TRINITY_DN4232_c0_g1_i2:39-983(+)
MNNNTSHLTHRRPWIDAASGFFSGIAGTVIGHPLDTVKVRLQTQPGKYNGMFNCLTTIAKSEGVFALFKGIVAPIINLTILNSLSFTVYGQSKEIVQSMFDVEELRTPHYYLAGSMVGVFCSIISTPFEMVKVQMQLDNITKRMFSGSIQCAMYIKKNHGVHSLFYGYLVNAAREILFCTIYFGTYDNTKKFLANLFGYHTTDANGEGVKAPPSVIMLSGGLSGMLAWFGSFPLDVIKSNVQTCALSQKNRYKHGMSILMERWNQVKIRAFYSGIGPSLIRAFFVSGTRFSAYEFALNILTKTFHTNTTSITNE